MNKLDSLQQMLYFASHTGVVIGHGQCKLPRKIEDHFYEDLFPIKSRLPHPALVICTGSPHVAAGAQPRIARTRTQEGRRASSFRSRGFFRCSFFRARAYSNRS